MPDNDKVDDSGIDVLLHIPEPHPGKEFFEDYDISFEQIGRRILKSPEEVKQILNGKITPNKWVEKRIQDLMKNVRMSMEKKEK